MLWACMAVNGTDSLLYFNDMTPERNSKMYSEVYVTKLSVTKATKLIRWHFTVQMDNNSKYITKTTRDILKTEKLNILQ